MKTRDTTIQPRERSVEIAAGGRTVKGALTIPADPRSVVAFAHGSGSGRFSRAINSSREVCSRPGWRRC